MDKRIKEWGIVGLIIYILSLPIAVWRSSKIGRVFFIFLFAGSILWFAPKALDIYFTKFRFRQEEIKFQEKMRKEESKFQEKLSKLNNGVEELNNWVENKKKDYSDILAKNINIKYQNIMTEMFQVEQGLDLIREEERAVIKSKIKQFKSIMTQESSKFHNTSGRIMLNEIAENISILSDEEKKNFYLYLKNLGWEVENENGDVATILIPKSDTK